jgi:hypothetical protein
MLRAGVTVKTAPPAAVGPWSCVWRNRDGLRCHVGRVYDDKMFDDNAEEYSQGQFPRKKPSSMTLIGGAVVTNAPDTNMSSASTGGFVTGSVKVYYKTNFGRASYGNNDLEEVPDSGYAFWPEGKYKSQAGAVYVILSRLENEGQQPKWVLSLSLGSNIQKKDFKIACIAGTSCIQIWQSDIVFGKGGNTTAEAHPFKIIRNPNPAIMTFSVTEGTVNNEAVGLSSYSLGNFQVWLKTYPSLSISVVASAPITDDTQAWLQIGRITHVPKVPADGTYVTTIYQYVKNSIWLERFKCGSDTAQYWYSQI